MTRELVNIIHAASELSKTSRLGMFRFGLNDVWELLDLADNPDFNDVDGIIQNLDKVQAGGGTKLFRAVTDATAMFDRNVRPIGGGDIASRTLIIFTDADPNERTDKTLRQLKMLMDKGIHVVMIGKQLVNDATQG